MKDLIYIIIISFLCFFLVRKGKEVSPEVEVIHKTDTIFKVDTIIQYKPKPIYVKSEPDTVYIPSIDSTITLDKEIKVYEDSTYRVQISGFKPFLDEIAVYPRETIVYREKVSKIKEKRRFTQGIQVGLGYGMINNKPDIFIGYGFQYNF